MHTQLVTYHINQGPFQKRNSTQMVSTQASLIKGLFTEDWAKFRELTMDAEAPRSRNRQKAFIMILRPEGHKEEWPSKSWHPGGGAVGQKEEGQIYCHNLPEPGYFSREKAKKKDQLLLLFSCLLSACCTDQKQPETSQPGSLGDAMCKDQP